MKKFDQGQTVRITVTFRDFSNALVNPSSVSFFVQTDADEEWTETAGVSPDSTGIYHHDVDTVDQSGVYRWRCYGSGTTSNAIQDRFYVTPMDPVDTDPGI